MQNLAENIPFEPLRVKRKAGEDDLRAANHMVKRMTDGARIGAGVGVNGGYAVGELGRVVVPPVSPVPPHVHAACTGAQKIQASLNGSEAQTCLLDINKSINDNESPLDVKKSHNGA
jgi:hypothetical protein